MSNPTELLPGTSIAVIRWRVGINLDYVRVYTQDLKGDIRESRYDGQSWTGGTAADVIANAKLRSPIAALSYNNGIRVYYLSADNILQEAVQDNYDGGRWVVSNLGTHNFEASPASRLAVIGKTKLNHNISLYYQRPDEDIGEIRLDDNAWVRGPSFGNKPLFGTGLAALTFKTKDTVGIRVFYQRSDGTLTDAYIDNGEKWFDQGKLNVKGAAPATNLSAFSHGTDEEAKFQLYFFHKSNSPSKWAFYSGEWHDQKNPGNTISSPSSGIAAFANGSADNLRMYIQDETNQIQEYSWLQSWKDWKKDAIIPTGNVQ